MREIKTERLKLLDKVRENRTKHVAAYKEAMDGYKEAALKAIDDGIEKLRKQINDLKSGEIIALAHVYFVLPVPENHAKDYDQVIAMLDMSVDEHLTIKSDEFAMYVMDDWSWKKDFQTTTANYSKSK